MKSVRHKDTKPELVVRRVLHALGLRFRVQRKDLPGTPDIVLPKHRTVIFVHGCFWHRHAGCRLSTTPQTRQEYWLPKFEANIERDTRKRLELEAIGWRVLVVWECETRDPGALSARLSQYFPVQ